LTKEAFYGIISCSELNKRFWSLIYWRYRELDFLDDWWKRVWPQLEVIATRPYPEKVTALAKLAWWDIYFTRIFFTGIPLIFLCVITKHPLVYMWTAILAIPYEAPLKTNRWIAATLFSLVTAGFAIVFYIPHRGCVIHDYLKWLFDVFKLPL